MPSPRLSHRSGGRNSQEFVRAHSHGSSLNGWRDAGDANAPLLQDANASDTTGRAEWVVEDSEEEAPLTFFGEVKRLLHITGPLSIESTLWFVCSSLMSLAFVGHLGALPLAAVVLANSVYNISGYSLVVGMAAGMNSLSGQAFGAGNLQAMSLLLQRALILSCGLSCIIWAAWTQLYLVLPLLGQDARIAAEASRFLQISAPSLLLNSVAICLRNHLLAQLDVVVASLMSAALTVVTPCVNYLLIYVAHMGIDGAALANNVEAALYCAMLLTYFIVKERGLVKSGRHTWHGWSWGAFRGWGQYLAIALPALSMKCTEWWLFEALVLMAGILPNPEQASAVPAAINLHDLRSVSVTGIAYNLTSLAYLAFPLGLCDALSTMVATQLGGGRWRGARHSARVALCLAAAVMAVAGAIIGAGRNVWPRLFTHDAQVMALCATILPLTSVSTFTDGINATLAGVVTGAGRQATGALINFCTYWGVGLSLAATLAFYARLGVRGLWFGVMAGSATQTVVMLTYVLALNWERESRRARATFTPPASAPAVGAETTGAVDSGGAANGDLEQGAALLNVNGGSGAAAPGAAAAVPDQPLGVAAGAGALAPGHEAPVRQALL